MSAATGRTPAGRRAGRWLWIAIAWSAVASCLLSAVAVIDTRRFLYGDTPVLRVGHSPSAVVVSPDGRTVYLANSDDSITPVSAATGKPGWPIAISGGSPGGFANSGGMAITPDGRTLFTLVENDKSESAAILARVDLRTGRETGQVRAPGGVADFVMTKDGTTLYVLSGRRVLYAVNAATGRIERRISAPDAVLENAETMLLARDASTLYVTTSDDEGVGAAETMTGAVTPLDLTDRHGRAGHRGRMAADLARHHPGRPHALRRHRRASGRDRAGGA